MKRSFINKYLVLLQLVLTLFCFLIGFYNRHTTLYFVTDVSAYIMVLFSATTLISLILMKNNKVFRSIIAFILLSFWLAISVVVWNYYYGENAEDFGINVQGGVE
jgi:hypothetical membrane protein